MKSQVVFEKKDQKNLFPLEISGIKHQDEEIELTLPLVTLVEIEDINLDRYLHEQSFMVDPF